jgi:site-specific DNA-methyltransferase (adenine-specific)
MKNPHLHSLTNGRYSLYHGDFLEISLTLPDQSVDCIWTDPPYFLSNGGSTCQSGKWASVSKGLWDQSKGIDWDHSFHLQWIGMCHRILKPHGTIWVTGTMHSYPSVGFALQQSGFKILNDIVWVKPAPPPNLGCRAFTHSTEIIFWACKAGSRGFTFNYDDMKLENGGKQMRNVWTFSPPKRREKALGKHPTQKPVDLISRCLRASTNPGDIILDPFAGTSSTGVAAIALDRIYLGVEMESVYCEISRSRLEQSCGR